MSRLLSQEGHRSDQNVPVRHSNETIPANVAIFNDLLMRAASIPVTIIGMPAITKPWKRGKGERYVTPENQADNGNHIITVVTTKPANNPRNKRDLGLRSPRFSATFTIGG